MNFKLLITALLFLSTLSGCSITPQQPYPTVDNRTLLRSLVYTQRELLTLELTDTVTTNQARHSLLLKSYCDLIDRKFIPTNAPPQCDQQENSQTQACTAQFHDCLSYSSIKNGQCIICERKLAVCLNGVKKIDSNSRETYSNANKNK